METIITQKHTGIVISKDSSLLYGRQLEVKINDTYFINPSLTYNEWDSLQIGDIVTIKSLRLVYPK